MTEAASNDNIPAIGFARVLAGFQSFKDLGIKNVNDTFKGQILTAGGDIRFAFLKDLEVKELANEVMATSLGRRLGMNVPPAYLASVSATDINFSKAPITGDARIVFASCDVGSPSVSSLIVRGGAVSRASLRLVIDKLLVGDLSGVYEFDEWSANVDRHLGNLLLSGDGSFWLIDHGRCFSGPDWNASDLVPTARYGNRMSQWVTPNLTPQEIDTLYAAVGRLQDAAGKIDLLAVGQEGFVNEFLGNDDFDALVSFLQKRIPEISRLASSALGRLM